MFEVSEELVLLSCVQARDRPIVVYKNRMRALTQPFGLGVSALASCEPAEDI